MYRSGRKFLVMMPGTRTVILIAWAVTAASSVGTRPAAAVEHDKELGEPYTLAGNRLVFTTWIHVRPGEFDWRDRNNKSVFASKVDKIGPFEARFKPTDVPWGIRLEAEPAQRVGPIITGGKRPWEDNGIYVNTLMYDEGKYRLWGIGQDENLKFDENNEKGNRLACYLESDDCKTWRRPSLGLIEYNGNRDNNLVQMSPHATVFKDPVAPPEERYKAIWVWFYDRKLFDELKDRRPWSTAAVPTAGKIVYALMAAVSPDGLKWTDLPEPISIETSDTHNICYYDKLLDKYILYTRTREINPRAKGFPPSISERSSNLGRRAIGRTESKNFREFPLSQTIIETTSDMLPSDTYYTNGYTTIPGAPDHHLMFPTIWHQASDSSSFALFTSHDGKLWSKAPGSPVLKTAEFGQWDGGSIFNAPGLVELPDGSWAMPYTGYSYPHKYPRGAWKYAVGLAVWPKGRLMALVADSKAEFATAAIVAPGKILKINAVTTRAGSILIEAADINGKAIAGRSFAEAVSIIGDHFWTQVKWKDHDDLGVEPGKPVEFRFRMDQAKLYGLEFE